MDNATLTALIKQRASIKDELDAVESAIKGEILSRKQTIKAGGFIVKYSEGRKSYQYEKVGRINASDEVISKYTTPHTDWKLVCKEAGLVNIPFTTGKPCVSFVLDKSSQPITAMPEA